MASSKPRIDEILDQLGGARYFSTLDLASGYWQVPLREEDMEKTAFSVGADQYEFANKCQFAQESVKFLRHIVSARGTEPDSSKVEAVREFATPTSLADVRAFVGMASYYRRFIKNLNFFYPKRFLIKYFHVYKQLWQVRF